MGDEEWVIPLMILGALGAIGVAIVSTIQEVKKPKDQRSHSGVIDPGGGDEGWDGDGGCSDSGDCGGDSGGDGGGE